MKNRLLCALTLIAALLTVLPVAAVAEGDVIVSAIDWATNAGVVRFHVQFSNPGSLLSAPATGEVRSQPYGAFLPDYGTIGVFEVPPLMPDSFFDVFFDVPLSNLPPSATTVTPWGNKSATAECGPDIRWAGNIDIVWTRGGGGGGGHVNYHTGTLLVCPGGGISAIHVLTGCAGPVTWSFGPLCPNWYAALVNEDGSPAPSPLPAGWTGYINVWADCAPVPIGTICCFALNLTCEGVTVPVNLCAEACLCPPVGAESSTWGDVKSLFR